MTRSPVADIQAVRGRIKDTSSSKPFLDDTDIDTAIQTAVLTEYSRHRPREVAVDLAGTDSPYLSLGGVGEWESGFSRVVSVEYPALDVSSDVGWPEILDPVNEWRVYESPTALFLHFRTATPSTTETVRLTITKTHRLTRGSTAAVLTPVAISIASPGVVTYAGHALVNGNTVKFATTGALPTGLNAGTTYYVRNATEDTFSLSATAAGTLIVTSGTQNGVHSLTVLTGTGAATAAEDTVYAHDREAVLDLAAGIASLTAASRASHSHDAGLRDTGVMRGVTYDRWLGIAREWRRRYLAHMGLSADGNPVSGETRAASAVTDWDQLPSHHNLGWMTHQRIRRVQ